MVNRMDGEGSWGTAECIKDLEAQRERRYRDDAKEFGRGKCFGKVLLPSSQMKKNCV